MLKHEIELTECLDCLQMRPRVNVDSYGFCLMCQREHTTSSIFNVWPKIQVTTQYEQAGLYAVSFVGGGTKLGKSTNIKSRLRSYMHPWCKPIDRIFCIAVPSAQLGIMEKRLLASCAHSSVQNSEYFKDLTHLQAIECMKDLVTNYITIFQDVIFTAQQLPTTNENS